MPNFESATREGEIPIVISGKFGAQLSYAINQIKLTVDLNSESVAFLHPKGYGWFKTVRQMLTSEGLAYVELSAQEDWPEGDANIALSTLHSAKGLEFDHVFIIGLDAETTSMGNENVVEIKDDERLDNLRRLVAMGVGRARKTVVIGYRPDATPAVAAFFDPAACKTINV